MNVFISQPMRGRSLEELREERKGVMDYLRKLYPNETVVELNSLFTADIQSKNEPLRLLGMSIEMLAEADVAVFANYWSVSRGCQIENTCAQKYGIPIVDLGD